MAAQRERGLLLKLNELYYRLILRANAVSGKPDLEQENWNGFTE